jgi:hypothetical protein
LAGCTPGAAPHAKNRREHGTTPGEFGYEASTGKPSRQSPIIVRLGADSVNRLGSKLPNPLWALRHGNTKFQGFLYGRAFRAAQTQQSRQPLGSQRLLRAAFLDGHRRVVEPTVKVMRSSQTHGPTEEA